MNNLSCPFSVEMENATYLRKCKVDGVSCGESGWKTNYLNCPEYKHQKWKEEKEKE